MPQDKPNAYWLRVWPPVDGGLFFALRETLCGSYTPRHLRADLLAGLVVGLVATPLSMALAIASGAPPQHGLYTAIVAGALTALLGGSRTQVTGPTAAFVIIIAPITAQYGLGGLFVATALAGIMLAVMGTLRLGRLIEFMPYPVTIGFTAGIAIVIAFMQLKDLLGLSVEAWPETFTERITTLIVFLPSARLSEVIVGSVTLVILMFWPKVSRRIPGPLVALGAVSTGVAWVTARFPEWSVATINSRFTYIADGVIRHGIPQTPPSFALPWNFPGPEGRPFELSLEVIEALLPAAFAIAALSAIESLLSAVIADGMTGKKHNPDSELKGLGFANIITSFFGGFAATGAIARTATNIRAGACSPFASITHAVFILGVILSLAPLLGYVPMSAMAALLLVVAWNMAEARHVVYMVKVAPRADTVVLFTCLTLTVVFNMVIAVVAGFIMAALLFIRRMSDLTEVKLVGHHELEFAEELPAGIVVYEIAGPFFFGSAQKAVSVITGVSSGVKVVVLDLREASAMDATGMVNLEFAISKLGAAKVGVILAGVRPHPLDTIRRSRLREEEGKLLICESFEDAIASARVWAGAK